MANPGVTTLGTLRLSAQRRADMENSDFVATSEWNDYLNASCQAWYDKLIQAYGNDYEVASTYAITTDGVNDSFALPVDFYKLLGVDMAIAPASTSGGWVTLKPFAFADRNRYTLPNTMAIWGYTNLRYRLRGGFLWLSPLPSAGQPLRLWYAPRFTPLVNDSDTFDGINGWEEWVILDAAIKACVKEKTDTQDLRTSQAAEEQRLVSITENRDAGAPMRVVDSSASNGGNWGGGEGGYDY